jgi:hypothetical protein
MVSALMLLLLGSCRMPTSSSAPTWQDLSLQNKLVVNLEIIENYLYACAARDGLYRLNLNSTKAEWEYLGFADTSLPLATNAGVMTVCYNSFTKEIFVGINNPVSISLGQVGLFKSADMGKNWEQADEGIHFLNIKQTSIVKSLKCVGQQVFAGTNYSIYKRDGNTWKRVSGDNDLRSFAPISSICADIRNPTYMVAGGESGFFTPFFLTSSDSGQTWIETNSATGMPAFDQGIWDVAMVNQKTIYACMLQMIVKSEDTGRTWRPVYQMNMRFEPVWKIGINLANPEEFLATGISLVHSKDGGATSESIPIPMDTHRPFALAIDWSNRTAYVSTISLSNPKSNVDFNSIYSVKF